MAPPKAPRSQVMDRLSLSPLSLASGQRGAHKLGLERTEKMAKRKDPPKKPKNPVMATADSLREAREQGEPIGKTNKLRDKLKAQLAARGDKYKIGLENDMPEKYQHSPDRYNDTQLTLEVPRLEYHAQQKNVGVETPKKVGGVPAKVEQHSGLENLRSDYKTLEGSNNRSTPGGTKNKWPSAVQSYDDSSV
jgi:hypothetical protein